jgi:hypothetical protein
MSRPCNTLLALAALVLSFFAVSGMAQETQASSRRDVDSEIETMRADVRADRTAIVADAMKFNPEESSAFWPIYKEYEFEVGKVNDQRVDLVRSYASKFDNLSDEDARTLMEKNFDLDSERVKLRKKFSDKFLEKLPATTVARFFQLEHRLDLATDAIVANKLPLVLSKSTSQSATAN